MRQNHDYMDAVDTRVSESAIEAGASREQLRLIRLAAVGAEHERLKGMLDSDAAKLQVAIVAALAMKSEETASTWEDIARQCSEALQKHSDDYVDDDAEHGEVDDVSNHEFDDTPDSKRNNKPVEESDDYSESEDEDEDKAASPIQHK